MGDQRTVEEIEARIAARLREIQADFYGTAPRKAEAHYVPGRLAVVILRETFTKAEKHLIATAPANRSARGASNSNDSPRTSSSR